MRQLHKLFMSIPEQINILRRRGLICLLGFSWGFGLAYLVIIAVCRSPMVVREA